MDSFTGNNNNSQQPNNNNNAQQKEDYLDKGLDAAEKKYGGASAQDTDKYRGVNEKIVRHLHLYVCCSHDHFSLHTQLPQSRIT